MAKQLFANNASSLLAASIDDDDLTIQVQSGYGVLFPNPGAGEYFLATLENDDGDIEVVKITSRATDLLTVETGGRGQEGTSAQSWTNGQARVEVRLTQGTMETFIQRGGDSMEGDLNMDGNEFQDAVLTGSGTKITAGEIIDVPLRGATGIDSNEVRVPTDGTRATAGGSKILVEGDDEQVRVAAFEIGMITLWYGNPATPPAGWAICNGDNGTPDLRDRFIVGAGGAYTYLSTGGSIAPLTTSAEGGHTHVVESSGHALTIEELPAHAHRLGSRGSNASSNGSNDRDFVNNFGEGSFTVTSESVGGGEAHDHDITIDTQAAHTHTVTPSLPPYRGMNYIMFIGF